MEKKTEENVPYCESKVPVKACVKKSKEKDFPVDDKSMWLR